MSISIPTRTKIVPNFQRESAEKASSRSVGTIFGILAVLGWASFNVGSAAALREGFLPNDLTMLRYGVSAIICLPVLARTGFKTLGGLGWARGFLLAMAAGPLFGALVNAAMQFAPLSHTATIVPAVSMLGGMILGMMMLGETVTRSRWIGAGIMVGGLSLLMFQGGATDAHDKVWFGDILFIAAGGLWTAYTLMLKKWSAQPVLAVSAVNVISGVAYLPIYIFLSKGHVPDVSFLTFAQAAIIQGAVAAFLTIYAYAQSVRYLGAGRAAVFPAAVAPVALSLGVIVLGTIPTMQQIIAVAITMIGLVAAIGLRGSK